MGRFARRGQILPLFAISLIVVIAMAALVFDAANALVVRRNLQNAGDAAALAGSNVIQTAGSSRRCTDGAGPRADIVAAVYASIDANLPGFDHGGVTITCDSAWDDQAVKVRLDSPAAMFFAGPILGQDFDITTSSTAVNGQIATSIWSVLVLDPSNDAWPNGRRGCPALLLSGGPTVQFDGSVQVNSACSAASGGALSTNGNASTLTMSNSAKISLVGGYAAGSLTITPAPLTGQPAVLDPLRNTEAPLTTGMTTQSTSRLVLNNVSQVLEPGIYRGGIELRNSSTAYLRPGIYYIDGGGIQLGAQSSLFAIRAGQTSTTTATWSTDCPDTACGVLLYNAGPASGTTAMGQVQVAAGATLKLRAYDERANGNAYPDLRNILLWQARTPAPSSTYAQPTVELSGGGDVDVSGTVYAPAAPVLMGGNSGGSGGGNVNLTLQFIAWDLQIQGNVSFRFFYTSNDFARPTDYGLVE